MNNRITILEELTGISPLVAGIPRVTPYSLPTGYFDSLAEQILDGIREPHLSGQINLTQKMPYEVPRGYFEGFAEQLMKRIHSEVAISVQEELETLSPLLNKLNKQTPFTTPEGYFSELADNLVSGMKAVDFVKEELETPLLRDIKKRPVYSVPPLYFENFPAVLLAKIHGKRSASIIKMPARRIMQYAAAAVVTAVIVMGTWFVSQNRQKENTLTATVVNDSTVSQNISKLSDEAIVNYVENDVLSTDVTALLNITNADIDEEDMQDMLADIPDEELNRYVESHGGEKFLTN